MSEGSARRRCLSVVEMQAKRNKSGKLAGEPFFVVRRDKAGCYIWGRNVQNTHWDVARDDTDGLAELPRHSVPGKGFEASEKSRDMELEAA